MLIASYAVATGLSGFLVAQPFVTAVFLMTCLFQIGFYDRFKEWKKSAVVVAGVSVTNVGIFLGLVFGLRAALNAGVNLWVFRGHGTFVSTFSAYAAFGPFSPQ